MKKKILVSILSVFVCCVVCILMACSNQSENSQENKNGVDIKYGTQTDTSKTLKLKNATGQDIKTVSIQLVGDAASKELSASEADIWNNDATAEIYLEEANGTTADTQSGSVSLKAAYNITALLNDGTSVTLHNLTQAGVEDYKDAKLCINSSDKLGYIEYTDPTGASINTLASEQKIVADQKAAADAEKAKQDASKSNSNGSSSGSSSKKGSSSNNSSGNSSSGQSTDDCTAENIILR